MNVSDTISPEIHFFVGKGGVGKSTTSALTALHLARSGHRTLLVSMDPAHNQCDLFECEFSEKPRRVAGGLWVKEVDTDFWIARYLKETQAQIRRTYIYESAFNLEKHFKVIRFSPGLEEYALLLAFENVLLQAAGMDAIVFDMAPTALSLRFFSLPGVSLTWLQELLSLRDLICRKKEIIANIRLGKYEWERDRVKQKLVDLNQRHMRLRQRLLSQTTRVHLVMNADRLSLSEALRIRRRLADIGMAIDRVVVNKVRDSDDRTHIGKAFGAERLCLLPEAAEELVGMAALSAHAARFGDVFDGFLPPAPCDSAPSVPRAAVRLPAAGA